jgi:hypothetical protein
MGPLLHGRTQLEVFTPSTINVICAQVSIISLFLLSHLCYNLKLFFEELT